MNRLDPDNDPYVRMTQFMPWLGVLSLLMGLGIFLFMVLPVLDDWHDARDWEPVEATLLRVALETHPGSDRTTYEAVARYRYRYGGRERTGDRVAIASGGDNIGGFQENLYRQLEQARARGETVTAWVNPLDPAEAVLNRDLRFELILVYLLFVALLPVTGIVLLTLGLGERDDPFDPSRAPPDRPWLGRASWSRPLVASGSEMPLVVAWSVPVVWLAIWGTTAVYLVDEILAMSLAGAGSLVALLAGVGLAGWAVWKTLGQRRFGVLQLQMDPHPGAIGGDVAGEIDLPLLHDPAIRFAMELQCLEVTRVREGRATFDERILWQDRRAFGGVATPEGLTRVPFRFAVPDGLPASSPPGETFHRWVLLVGADLRGVDLERRFELPVFPTGERSRRHARIEGRSLKEPRNPGR